MVRAEAGERISPTVPASVTAGKSNTVETPPLKPSDDKIREECSRISQKDAFTALRIVRCGDNGVKESEHSIFYKWKKVIVSNSLSFTQLQFAKRQVAGNAKYQGRLQVRRVFLPQFK